ncbi:hypothetical protein ABBQ38_001945 [Trebouxia sp. C0009 RCD-2024]
MPSSTGWKKIWRIGFEHKQSSHDKDEHCSRNSILQARAVPQKEYTFGEGRAQAYSALAQTLIQDGDMAAGTASSRKPPEQLEKTLARPAKKLKRLMQGSGLLDQVESVVSHSRSTEHQVQTAFEIQSCVTSHNPV